MAGGQVCDIYSFWGISALQTWTWLPEDQGVGVMQIENIGNF